MTDECRQQLLGLANAASPSEEMQPTLVREWEEYFLRMKIPPDLELTELNAVIRWRVQIGGVSIRSPKAENNWL